MSHPKTKVQYDEKKGGNKTSRLGRFSRYLVQTLFHFFFPQRKEDDWSVVFGTGFCRSPLLLSPFRTSFLPGGAGLQRGVKKRRFWRGKKAFFNLTRKVVWEVGKSEKTFIVRFGHKKEPVKKVKASALGSNPLHWGLGKFPEGFFCKACQTFKSSQGSRSAGGCSRGQGRRRLGTLLRQHLHFGSDSAGVSGQARSLF